MKKYFVLTFILCFVCFFNLNAQNKDVSHDVNTDIVELSDFHEVIYPIWHMAYPAKDYESLKEAVPGVIEKSNKIYTIKLPGILREREDKWKAGLEKFKTSVNNYVAAAKGTDNEALLKAAETMHSNYEMLIRIVKPVPVEVESFHKELYVIYHVYLPEKNYDKIKEVSVELLNKAEKLKGVKLSKKLLPKQEEFNKLCEVLVSSIKELENSTKENFENKVETMHSNYQKVEAFFD